MNYLFCNPLFVFIGLNIPTYYRTLSDTTKSSVMTTKSVFNSD